MSLRTGHQPHRVPLALEKQATLADVNSADPLVGKRCHDVVGQRVAHRAHCAQGDEIGAQRSRQDLRVATRRGRRRRPPGVRHEDGHDGDHGRRENARADEPEPRTSHCPQRGGNAATRHGPRSIRLLLLVAAHGVVKCGFNLWQESHLFPPSRVSR